VPLTAFFYTLDDRNYFITNWHKVSGRRPWDSSVISTDGGIPDNLVVRFPYRDKRFNEDS
jgi:hypothetical protein